MRELKLRSMGTSTTVTITADGSLVIDCYDFSADARDQMGGDVGYTATVSAAEKERALALLVAEACLEEARSADDQLLLESHQTPIYELLRYQGLAREAQDPQHHQVRPLGLRWPARQTRPGQRASSFTGIMSNQ